MLHHRNKAVPRTPKPASPAYGSAAGPVSTARSSKTVDEDLSDIQLNFANDCGNARLATPPLPPPPKEMLAKILALESRCNTSSGMVVEKLLQCDAAEAEWKAKVNLLEAKLRASQAAIRETEYRNREQNQMEMRRIHRSCEDEKVSMRFELRCLESQKNELHTELDRSLDAQRSIRTQLSAQFNAEEAEWKAKLETKMHDCELTVREAEFRSELKAVRQTCDLEKQALRAALSRADSKNVELHAELDRATEEQRNISSEMVAERTSELDAANVECNTKVDLLEARVVAAERAARNAEMQVREEAESTLQRLREACEHEQEKNESLEGALHVVECQRNELRAELTNERLHAQGVAKWVSPCKMHLTLTIEELQSKLAAMTEQRDLLSSDFCHIKKAAIQREQEVSTLRSLIDEERKKAKLVQMERDSAKAALDARWAKKKLDKNVQHFEVTSPITSRDLDSRIAMCTRSDLDLLTISPPYVAVSSATFRVAP